MAENVLVAAHAVSRVGTEPGHNAQGLAARRIEQGGDAAEADIDTGIEAVESYGMAGDAEAGVAGTGDARGRARLIATVGGRAERTIVIGHRAGAQIGRAGEGRLVEAQVDGWAVSEDGVLVVGAISGIGTERGLKVVG